MLYIYCTNKERDSVKSNTTIDPLILSEIPFYTHIGKKRIDGKDSEYYPKNDTIFLKFSLDKELKKFEKRLQVDVNTKDSNCIFFRVSENNYKLYIDEQFDKNVITFNVNLSPKKNCIVINDGYEEDEIYRKNVRGEYGADYKAKYFENEIIPVQKYMHLVKKQ